MVRAVAERALTRQGYSVLTAENGEAALEVIEASGRPDLLISDVVMPTMDGPTMVRIVRERYPDLPILFHVGLCRGTTAQVDRPRQCIVPAQAVFGPATGGGGARRARRTLNDRARLTLAPAALKGR